MPSKKKRAGSAHAEDGRFEFKGHASRGPADVASGGTESEMLNSASQPVNSQDISGDVSNDASFEQASDANSRSDSAIESPGNSSLSSAHTVRTDTRPKGHRKLSVSPSGSRLSRRFGVSKSSLRHTHPRRRKHSSCDRELMREFEEDSARMLGPQSGSGADGSATEATHGQGDSTQREIDQLDRSVQSLDLSSTAGREAALQYLASEHVVKLMTESNSLGALQTTIEMIKNGRQPKSDVSPARQSSPPPVRGRRRVTPTPGSFADLGQQYRLGSQGVVSALESKRKKEVYRASTKLAGDAAGVIPETPVGCPTLEEHEFELLTHTVSKILARRKDLAELPRGVRMRKAISMASREIHKADVEGIRKRERERRRKEEEEAANKEKDSPSVSPGGSSPSGSDSESVGDTISSRSSKSGSTGTYDTEDSFVDDGSDADSDFEKKKHRKAREEQRYGAMNGLGTPKKSATTKEACADRDRVGNPGLLLLGDDELKQWTIGTSAYKQGLNWEAYVHHKQAYDNYMQHKGKWSDRSFKSIIHAKLVPTVCAICGFRRSQWKSIEDARLILKLERVLSPSRSTDFAMELRAIKLIKHKNFGEPLMARYEVFAEKFIYKCAEAEDAGKRIKPNVIKSAFKSEVEKESVLKHWLQEVQWKGVEQAHRRLLRKLRETKSIEQLFNKDRAGSRRDDDDHTPDGDNDDQDRRPSGAGRGRGNRARGYAKKSNSSKRKASGRSNNFSSGAGSSKPKAKGEKGEKLRSWNYDKRGISWHTDTDLYDCYDKPCNRPFCQRCRQHGHTAEYCRKSDDTPGLTKEGYAQENAKGKAALRAPPPERDRGSSRSNKAKVEHRSAGSSDDDGSADTRRASSRSSSKNNHGSGRNDRASQAGSDDEDGAARGYRGRSCL